MTIKEIIVVKFKNSDIEKLGLIAEKYSWKVTDKSMTFDKSGRNLELIDSLNRILDEYNKEFNIGLNGELHNIGQCDWTYPPVEHDRIVAKIKNGKLEYIKV
jgi:hypothetical protein